MAQKLGHFLAREILGLICGHNIIYSFYLVLPLMQNAEIVSDFHVVMAAPLSVLKIL